MSKTLAEVRNEYDASLPEDAKERSVKIKVNGAKNFLRSVITDFEGDTKEAIEALVGTGVRGGGSVSRANPKKACLSVMVEKGEMSNIDCFMEFNKGPAEMREMLKYGVRDMAPAERVWVEFSNDTYTVVSVGEDAPEGWAGYMPITTEMDMTTEEI